MSYEENRKRIPEGSEIRDPDERKKRRRRFGATAVIAVVFAILLSVWRGLFDQSTVAGVFGVLSDSFLIPGSLFAGIGGLTWVAKFGFFDIMSYGCSSLLGRFIPFDSAYRRNERFYDYREKKERQGRTWNKDMVVVGVACILMSFLCVVFYSVL